MISSTVVSAYSFTYLQPYLYSLLRPLPLQVCKDCNIGPMPYTELNVHPKCGRTVTMSGKLKGQGSHTMRILGWVRIQVFYFLSPRESLKLAWVPCCDVTKKSEPFTPWWLENCVSLRDPMAILNLCEDASERGSGDQWRRVSGGEEQEEALCRLKEYRSYKDATSREETRGASRQAKGTSILQGHYWKSRNKRRLYAKNPRHIHPIRTLLVEKNQEEALGAWLLNESVDGGSYYPGLWLEGEKIRQAVVRLKAAVHVSRFQNFW